MSNYQWDTVFKELFTRCLDRYAAGDHDYNGYYSDSDLAFLRSIGYKPREFFDFVEDFGDGGEPSFTTAVMIASVRRDYLDVVMGGELSEHEISPDELPGRGETLDGIPWLPRIIKKARAKLRGELDPDIMYSCGGDRHFLSSNDLAPADFLRAVWAAGDNDQEIADYVKSRGT
ncbi:MAG: DUF5069 domain-containing protein, partial [Verrucomicrobiota bacterium]